MKRKPLTDLEKTNLSARMKIKNPNKVPPWENSKSHNTKDLWKVADKIFEIWKKTGWGYHRIANTIRCKNYKTIENMLKRFKKGWDPINDQSWLDFTLDLRLHTPNTLPYSEKLDRLLKRTQL